MNTFEFAPWYGEFGWEVMTWAPYCRKIARAYDHVVVTSFDGMAPIYADFAEFRAHDQTQRSLNYIKRYRIDGLYHRYGQPDRSTMVFDVLIHGRNIRRKAAINYQSWPQVIEQIACKRPWTVGWIGSEQDYYPGWGYDLRGIKLQRLMDLIAASKLVIGVSSGIMHLAAACGTDLVVWGDRRSYFGETLEQRYKITWNPFDVRVAWIDADDWQPSASRIIAAIAEQLERRKEFKTVRRNDHVMEFA